MINIATYNQYSNKNGYSKYWTVDNTEYVLNQEISMYWRAFYQHRGKIRIRKIHDILELRDFTNMLSQNDYAYIIYEIANKNTLRIDENRAYRVDKWIEAGRLETEEVTE